MPTRGRGAKGARGAGLIGPDGVGAGTTGFMRMSLHAEFKALTFQVFDLSNDAECSSQALLGCV